MPQEINATVIIKSPDESDSSRGMINPMQAGLGDFLPDLQTVINAARYFRDAGFRVRPNNDCINIEGSSTLFEAIFGIHLGQDIDNAANNIHVPERLKDILVRVIFSNVLIKH
jgi:hypothetical protein